MSKFFSSKLAPNSVNTGLLIIRVVFGIMLCVHGWQKLANFSDMAPKFYDPLHVSPTVSLALTVFAEFFCSALVVIGLFTRLSAVPVVFLMAVITYVVNRHEALTAPGHEMGILFLAAFLGILFAGGGRFSVDGLIRRK
ncbi:putative oxidoreductase [Chitinophaga costaii]|uniref:Putative oxidoreductase n=1 Tax=Chitinophaga costaii TaxID=1335309 RepID=A0A1C4FW19_9BACT|nr:DoxX family protein [Chitinophaga costaii]PUZ27241.1 DoxX family protein [Chitinophaga costaii]SCC59805.1 putative oxidoreductase [Chitinophaga costaii]